ncbi:MAG: cobalamin-dependent protein [Dehalococcoidales bacterium]|nr:cobalamin-dependent protein [Dehalococcoidales bacterium]
MKAESFKSDKKNSRRIRVLLAKLGLDGHDWGVLVVLMALRDAGMEVIYLGRHRTIDEIVAASIQEDVDIIGISSLNDAHRILAPKLVRTLKAKSSDTPVILGGFIPDQDFPELKAAGIAGIFPVGSKIENIVSSVREIASRKR